MVEWELEGKEQRETDSNLQGAAMCVSYNDSLNPLCRNRQPGPPWGAVVQPRAPDRRSALAVSISLVCVYMSVSVHSYIHIYFKSQTWVMAMLFFFFYTAMLFTLPWLSPQSGLSMSRCLLFKITCLTLYYQHGVHIKTSSTGHFCAVSQPSPIVWSEFLVFFFMFVGCYRMLVIEQLMKSSLCVWLCLCVRHLLIHSLIHQPGEAEIHYGTRLGSDVHMFHVLRWTEQRNKIEKKSRKNEKGYD